MSKYVHFHKFILTHYFTFKHKEGEKICLNCEKRCHCHTLIQDIYSSEIALDRLLNLLKVKISKEF